MMLNPMRVDGRVNPDVARCEGKHLGSKQRLKFRTIALGLMVCRVDMPKGSW
jgi:hypothetical protein